MTCKLIRLEEVLARNGEGRAKTYARIKSGLYPIPLKLGKSSAWLESEDNIVRAARISGKSDEELRLIVRDLIAARSQAYTNAVNESRAPVRSHDGDPVRSAHP